MPGRRECVRPRADAGASSEEGPPDSAEDAQPYCPTSGGASGPRAGWRRGPGPPTSRAALPSGAGGQTRCQKPRGLNRAVGQEEAPPCFSSRGWGVRSSMGPPCQGQPRVSPLAQARGGVRSQEQGAEGACPRAFHLGRCCKSSFLLWRVYTITYDVAQNQLPYATHMNITDTLHQTRSTHTRKHTRACKTHASARRSEDVTYAAE